MIYPDIFYPSNRLWFPDQYFFLVATFKCFICNILVGISRATKHSFSLYDCIAPRGIHFAGVVVQCCATMGVGIEMKRGFKHPQEQSDNRHQRYTNGILPPKIMEWKMDLLFRKEAFWRDSFSTSMIVGGNHWRACQGFLMISWMKIWSNLSGPAREEEHGAPTPPNKSWGHEVVLHTRSIWKGKKTWLTYRQGTKTSKTHEMCVFCWGIPAR